MYYWMIYLAPLYSIWYLLVGTYLDGYICMWQILIAIVWEYKGYYLEVIQLGTNWFLLYHNFCHVHNEDVMRRSSYQNYISLLALQKTLLWEILCYIEWAAYRSLYIIFFVSFRTVQRKIFTFQNTMIHKPQN